MLQPAACVHTTKTIRTIYLDGRSDDQLNILGEKINAYKIKNGCFRFTTSKNVKSAWKKRIQRKLSSPTYQGKIFHHLCQIQFMTESLPFSFLKNTSTMKNFQETKAEKFGRGNPWDSIQWNFLTVDDNFISAAIGNVYCNIRTCIHINIFFIDCDC